jgi:hypothetical protein
MHRIVLLLSLICAGIVVGLAQPSNAAAGWCWPNCSDWGFLGQSTSTYNGCWYSWGEVCSGWDYYYVNGVAKRCYPACDPWGNTTGMILYGFENRERIRGRFTVRANVYYIRPAEVGMGGYLRAQVAWWSGPASQINVAAVG